MGIKVRESLIHWNYFLALESDLEDVSRYIEFSSKNFKTYSIELAHLLLASASEVDVVVKEICKILAPNQPATNINQYREIIVQHLPEFPREHVYIPRFGISLRPWDMWRRRKNPKNPLWWKSYNNVKHRRDTHFEDANLQHVLNSMGGLLISIFYFYKMKFSQNHPQLLHNREVTQKLKPDTKLLRLSDDYYYNV